MRANAHRLAWLAAAVACAELTSSSSSDLSVALCEPGKYRGGPHHEPPDHRSGYHPTKPKSSGDPHLAGGQAAHRKRVGKRRKRSGRR